MRMEDASRAELGLGPNDHDDSTVFLGKSIVPTDVLFLGFNMINFFGTMHCCGQTMGTRLLLLFSLP